jgi:TP901 family phage tail tape measure protein
MSTIYSIALKLSLEGVNQLKNQFSIATQEIRKSSNNITNITKNSFKQIKELTNSSIGQLASLGAVTVALRNSIRTGIEFEDIFLRATAKIKDGVLKDSIEFNKLNKLVKDLGANTEFSTTEATQGLDFWAKAGKSVDEIIKLLPKSLDMAAASGLNLANVSSMIADSLGLFNLNANNTSGNKNAIQNDMNQLSKNVDRIMDNMFKTSIMTNISIEELFETSKLAGGLFTTAGQSMETFNSAVAILADNSMKGSAAGTSLRSIIARLTTPVRRAKYVLDKLGISIKDNKGNMRDLADILDDLKKSTEKYGNAEQLAIYKILAGQEAMNGLNFLVKEGGNRLRYYREQLEQSNGTTNKLANTFRTTTKITLDNFTSAIEGLAINLYEYLNPAINVILRTLTNMINLFNKITEDSKTLKIVFISLGIAVISAFAPISAIVIGTILLIGGLVRALQYCYKEFEWFREGINAGASFIKDVFFYIADTLKKFADITVNVFKSFSDGFLNGFLNLVTLIAHSIYEYLIYPIKILLIAISKIPKIGKAGQWGLDALKDFEDKTFTYTFNKENNGNNNKNSNFDMPQSRDITQAVMNTKYGNNDSQGNPLLSNLDLINGRNNQTNNSKSTLDININAPKQYMASYALNNPYNSGLMINVNGNQ